MKKKYTKFRWLLSLMMALVFGLTTLIGANASPKKQPENIETSACQTCHPAVHLSWEESAHGQALVDPIFQNNWNEQGKPRECLICHTTGYDLETNTWIDDGITCQACHNPITENHPLDPMPTNRSAALCETCHSQTVFEWKISLHRQTGLDCVDCHGQHTTLLRSEDAAGLCASCHRERASNFAHSAHSQENLTCPDCHLETLDGNEIFEGGHSAKDHSFRAKLDACNECHSYQMHDPIEVHTESGFGGFESPEISSDVAMQGLTPEPGSVNPVSFALLSALVGMAAGLLLAPWIQNWFHKLDFSKSANSSTDAED